MTDDAEVGVPVADEDCFQRESESDTDSVLEVEVGRPHHTRRLVLVSRRDVDPLDSHVQRFRRVRHAVQRERGIQRRQVEAAAESIRRLAHRVGPLNGDEIPREIRRHQWSALDVPLLWAAAEDDDQCPVMLWLAELCHAIPSVTVAGVELGSVDALAVGWQSLRDVMRSMGIQSREQFAEWIHSQGFPMPRWGAHISSRVQERILDLAIARDARVSAFECIFVKMTLAQCEQRQGQPHVAERDEPNDTNDVVRDVLEMLDQINLKEVFENRFLVLQSCPQSVRGRFRQAVRRALEAMSEAARIHGNVGEGRCWKLFCLLPMWLLRRCPGSHRVAKEELFMRFDLCQ